MSANTTIPTIRITGISMIRRRRIYAVIESSKPEEFDDQGVLRKTEHP
jgi:hypothetical protein